MSSGLARFAVAAAILVQVVAGTLATGTARAAAVANESIVPSVVGLSAADAKAKVQAAGLVPRFQLGQPATRGGDANTVYAMEPAAGTRLRQGTPVRLVIYAGVAAGPQTNTTTTLRGGVQQALPGAVYVPSVIGSSAKDAKAVLAAFGLVPKYMMGTVAPSPAAALTAYAQRPEPGATAVQGTPVAITLYSVTGSAQNVARLNTTKGELTEVRATPFVDRSEEIVNPRAGQLFVTATDLAAPAGAINLEVRRYLQVLPAAPGLLGTRWRLNWESRLMQSAQHAIIESEGLQLVFHGDPEKQRFVSASGDYLVTAAGRTTWTRIKEQIKDTFDAQGRLVERDARNGNKTRLTYDSTGRLAQITGPHGVVLQLRCDANGRLADIESSTGSSVHYGYSAGGQPGGDAQHNASIVRYAYNEQGALERIDLPRFGGCQFTYDGQGRVATRSFSDGTSERYEYDDANRTQRFYDTSGQLTTTTYSSDGLSCETTTPAGHKITVQNDDAGRPLTLTGPTGLVSRFEYDELGRTIMVEDPRSGPTRFEYLGETRLPTQKIGPGDNRTTFAYDRQQNLIQITDHKDPTQSATFAYGADGQLASVMSGNGQKRAITYDAAGRRQSVTDAAGNKWRYEYDLEGNLVGEIEPLGGVTRRTYDAEGRLASLTDPAGGTTTYAYQQQPERYVVSVTNPRGGVTQTAFDRRGRLVEVVDPAKRTTRYAYDAVGRLVGITDPLGHSRNFEYDAVGNLISETNPLGSVSRSEYDPLGNLIGVTDVSGATSRYDYSPTGRLMRTTDGSGLASMFDYDLAGRLLVETDAYGQSTEYEYTPQGRVAKLTTSAGPAVSYEYDAFGNVMSVRRGEHVDATYQYNALGRRIKETRSTGLEITYRHDALGRLVAWKDNQGGGETIQYDAAGRPIANMNGTGATTKLTYDPAGNLLATVDPLGHTTKREYDAAGQLAQVVGSNGDRATYEYDAAGRLAVAHHPGGGASRYAYDAAGNPVKTVSAGGGETKSTYDAAGRLLSATDAKGQTTKFVYDPHGRMLEKQLADGKVVRYQYDLQGRLARVDDGQFPVTYTYDQRGNVTSLGYPSIRRTLHYEYDAAGRKTRFVDSEGQVVEYEYDDADRLRAIKLADGAAISFNYDARDQVILAVYPNGITGSWRYDANGQVLSLTYKDKSGKTIAGWTHVYDAAGNRVQTMEVGGNATRFAYDPAGQLIDEATANGQAVRYEYTAGGNRSKKHVAGKATEYRYDKGDRLLQAGNESFAYDANGNLIERKAPAGVTRYTYDTENQLTGVELPGGKRIEYRYSPTGERIARRDDQGETLFVTDGLNLLAELGADLQPRAHYVHGPGVDQPLAMSRDGKTYFFHADQLGSVRRLTDGRGTVAASYDYEAFGQVRATNESVPNPFRFTAREFDAATGLYYYRARYYDPQTGRFLTVDPVAPVREQLLTLNPYQYALNNPLIYVDPLGTDESPTYNQTQLARDYLNGVKRSPLAQNNPRQAISLINQEIDFNARKAQSPSAQNQAVHGTPEQLRAANMELHRGKAEYVEQLKTLNKTTGYKADTYNRMNVPVSSAPPAPEPVPQPRGSGTKVMNAPKVGGTMAMSAPPAATPSYGAAAGTGLAVGGGVLLVTNVGLDINDYATGKRQPGEIAQGYVDGAITEAKWVGGGTLMGGMLGGVAGFFTAGPFGVVPGALLGAKWGGGAVAVGRTAVAAASTGQRVGEAFADEPVKGKEPANQPAPAGGWPDMPRQQVDPADIAQNSDPLNLGPLPNDLAGNAPDGGLDESIRDRAREAAAEADVQTRAGELAGQLDDNDQRRAAAGRQPGHRRQGGGGQHDGNNELGRILINQAIQEYNEHQQKKRHQGQQHQP